MKFYNEKECFFPETDASGVRLGAVQQGSECGPQGMRYLTTQQSDQFQNTLQ